MPSIRSLHEYHWSKKKSYMSIIRFNNEQKKSCIPQKILIITLCSERCLVSCFGKLFDEPFVSCTALVGKKTCSEYDFFKLHYKYQSSNEYELWMLPISCVTKSLRTQASSSRVFSHGFINVDPAQNSTQYIEWCLVLNFPMNPDCPQK